MSVSQVEIVGTAPRAQGRADRRPGRLERGERLPVLGAHGHGHHRGRHPAPVRRGLFPVHQAFDSQAQNGVIDLPDVMSRKKQVAPLLLSVL